MKFKIEKNIFENIISMVQPFLEKKDNSTITSHILLKIIESKLLIRSTDYEISIEIKNINVEDSIDGIGTINGSNLLGILKRLKNSEINIEKKDQNIIINQNKSNFKLPSYDHKEYPNIENIENMDSLNINSIDLMNSIKKITPSIDNNNPKFELNGALIDIEDNKISFVSTDTRRLSISNLNNRSNKIKKIIIPKKAIIEIQKLFIEDSKIVYDETTLIIYNDNIKFSTKLINGNFPDYKRIIPTNLKNNLNLNKDLMIESIKLITSIFSNIKITFNKNSILFESLDENSESKTQVDINLNIEKEFYIAVNAKYILDFLNLTNNKNIKIGFNESNMPFYLEEDNFFTIIMPIILEK